jgi:ATP-dependent DNA ligase
VQAVTALPKNEKWTFEIKFDRCRCVAVKRGTEVTLFSRNVLNKRFQKVAQVLASLGATSFSMGADRLGFVRDAFPFSLCKTLCRSSF